MGYLLRLYTALYSAWVNLILRVHEQHIPLCIVCPAIMEVYMMLGGMCLQLWK